MAILRALTITALLCKFITLAQAALPIATFTASGLRANEYIGYSVATDGQRVLIGTGAGSAFLYDPFTQQQLAKVTLPDPRFSTSVALQGMTGVVGTDGGAYVYNFSNLANITRITLDPTDGPATQVGGSVDMSGDVIITSGRADSSTPPFSGSAYLFDRVTGAQIARLNSSSATASDNFGISVAVDGDRAVVGAVSPFSSSASAVYLFDARPGVVGNRELARYLPAPALRGTNFGYNADISGETIIALETNRRSYAWQIGGSPTPLPQSTGYRVAGDALSISDTLIALGFEEEGLVRIYDKNGQHLRNLHQPPGSPIGFGFSVAIAGDLLVVGTPGGSVANSRAYVYRVQDVLVPEPTTGAIAIVGFIGAWRRRALMESTRLR